MKVTVEKLIGWEKVLNEARITVGKKSIDKDPSDSFKRSILVSEHSPIRMLTFEATWEDIPYWVAMHFRTHHVGLRSGDDDIYFVQTQRTDRTQKERDKIYQDAPVMLRAVLNAQTLINVSRVRLCRLASIETRNAWKGLMDELKNIEPVLTALCVPNCIYRGHCPEGGKCCGFVKTPLYEQSLSEYRELCK